MKTHFDFWKALTPEINVYAQKMGHASERRMKAEVVGMCSWRGFVDFLLQGLGPTSNPSFD